MIRLTTPINVALTVRSESVQQAYSSFRSDRFRVNRRYQRKLVWSVEEKQRLIDSIILALPLPLFLVAETSGAADAPLELIDGMQRLNAIFAFIEQEFDHQGSHFDLDTLADTKALKDAGTITQKKPVLDRGLSVAFANYSLALSVFRADEQSSIDEVFRRINSGGRRLSKQELRQAGTVSPLADLVRRLASRIRTDTSPGDIVPLRIMPHLSISNKNLPYGIPADEIFWTKQGILRRDDVRESADEQVILDILIDCLIEPLVTSGARTRDNYYSFSADSADSESIEATRIASHINIYGTTKLEDDFMAVYDTIRAVIDASGKRFGPLLGISLTGRGPRYFHGLFLAMFELMFKDSVRRTMHDAHALADKFAGIGNIAVITSGGEWTADAKRTTVNAFKGVISSGMEESSRGEQDYARFGWTSHIEILLGNAIVEQQLFDHKQGLLTLAPHRRVFDENALSKIIETLTAMANMGHGHTGYVALGIANDVEISQKIAEIDAVAPVEHRGFHVVGIRREATLRGEDLNSYWTWLMQKLSSHRKITPHFARKLTRDARLIPYKGLEIGLLKVEAVTEPVFFDGKLWERLGSSNREVPQEEYINVFSRFRQQERSR